MSDLKRRFDKILSQYPAKEYAIIIDSKFLTHSGRMVYVKLEDNATNQLVFYTRSGSVNSRNTDPSENNMILNPYELLEKRLSVSKIGAVDIKGNPSSEGAQITVCESIGFIVMESYLYSMIRNIVETNSEGKKTFMFSGVALESAVVSKLCAEFKLESIKRYGDLILSNNSPRFINKINRYNKFFTIQKAFIPVFIDFKSVYNPLLNDSVIQRTRVYKRVLELNRFVKADNITGYYMTHDELCEALGMSRRVRFTPFVFYQVFMGLLYPNVLGIASKSKTYYVRTEMKNSLGLKSKYSQEEFLQLIENLKSSEEAATTAEDKASVSLKIQELASYKKLDGLTVLCIENNSRMTNLGPHQLDTAENTKFSKIREYLEEAKIIYE